jgi:uncharacterized protein (DUF1499 family)
MAGVIKKMGFWALTIVLGVCLILVVLSLLSRKPPDTGILGGRLRPCPPRPNCVCSEYEGLTSFIESFRFSGPPEEAWQRLRSVLEAHGGKIEEEKADYLRATFTTRVFRFVDDLELRLDERNRRIHVRSASRVGSSDMGLNRSRVENLRAAFADSEKP